MTKLFAHELQNRKGNASWLHVCTKRFARALNPLLLLRIMSLGCLVAAMRSSTSLFSTDKSPLFIFCTIMIFCALLFFTLLYPRASRLLFTLPSVWHSLGICSCMSHNSGNTPNHITSVSATRLIKAAHVTGTASLSPKPLVLKGYNFPSACREAIRRKMTASFALPFD